MRFSSFFSRRVRQWEGPRFIRVVLSTLTTWWLPKGLLSCCRVRVKPILPDNDYDLWNLFCSLQMNSCPQLEFIKVCSRQDFEPMEDVMRDVRPIIILVLIQLPKQRSNLFPIIFLLPSVSFCKSIHLYDMRDLATCFARFHVQCTCACISCGEERTKKDDFSLERGCACRSFLARRGYPFVVLPVPRTNGL